MVTPGFLMFQVVPHFVQIVEHFNTVQAMPQSILRLRSVIMSGPGGGMKCF